MLGFLGDMFGNTAKETVKGFVETVDTLLNRFKASPEQIAAWELERAKLEEQAIARDQANITKLAELDAMDRDSARKREMSVKDNTNAVMAYTITGVLFVSTIYFNIYPPSQEVKPIVENVVMALRDGWLIVVAYYFGSSRSSSAKHDLIERLTQK